MSFEELNNELDDIREQLEVSNIDSVIYEEYDRYPSGRVRYSSEDRKKHSTRTISGLKLHILRILYMGSRSDDELEDMPVFKRKYRPSTVGKRRTELLQAGLVESAGRYYPYGGWPMNRWKLTEAGISVIKDRESVECPT